MPNPSASLKKIQIPLVGLGTWELRGNLCTRTVEEALSLGYEHIDTAHVYNNHKAIGKAIAGKRDALFITSKCIYSQLKKSPYTQDIEKACDEALRDLGTDYLDLYLLHMPDRDYPLHQILNAMHRLKEYGKVRHIGVSNFNIRHLQDLFDEGIEVAVNQVEFHPYLYQKDLLDFCNQHNILLVAYRSLGKKQLLRDPVVLEIAESLGKSPAQILLRWAIQHDVPTIPKASSKEHLEENLQIFDFELSPEQMETLNQLHNNTRFCDQPWGDFNYQ